MYKHAGQAYQRRYKVHEIAPQLVGASSEDFIPTAGNMSLTECEAERAQLKLELAKINNALQAAKFTNDKREIEAQGLRHQTIQNRLGLIRQRIHQLQREDSKQAFIAATKEIVSPDLLERIWERQREIIAENEAPLGSTA